MVGDEIIVEGSDIAEDKLEAAICRHLGRPEPETRRKASWGGSWQIDCTQSIKIA